MQLDEAQMERVARRLFDIQTAKVADPRNLRPAIVEATWKASRQEYRDMVETVVREVVAEILGEGMVRE